MKTLFALIVFTLSIGYSSAQSNLVNNGSFEENNICPFYMTYPFNNGNVLTCSNPNGGSPNYFNPCYNIQFQSYHVPSNFVGYQMPRTGNAYIGIDIWDKDYFVSEYIQIKLNGNLKQNHHYAFECFLSKAEMARYGTANFGVYFSADSVYYAPFEILPFAPQLINSPTNYFTDTTNWMPFTGTYLAQGGERFIILGNFNDSTQSVDTVYQYFGSNNHRDAAYYYIDDVSLIDLDSTLAVKENEGLRNVEIFPNPAKERITISDVGTNSVVSITDITGNEVLKTIVSTGHIDVSFFNAGLYFIYIENSKDRHMVKFVKE